MIGNLPRRIETVRALFIAALFASSFDILLVLNLGFNFRISQLLLLIPIVAALYLAVTRGAIVPVGFKWAILWAVFILLFVPNTDSLSRSVGYGLWLLLSLLGVFSCVQLFSTARRWIVLIEWYIYSFVFVACFGLIQFFAGVSGVGDAFLIRQWWIQGVFPRLNGFSYEPSYFASYLLIGWVFLAVLLEKKVGFIPRRRLVSIFSLLTLVIVLSSSRMVLVAIFVWYLQYGFRFIGRLVHGRVNRRYARNALSTICVTSVLVLVVVQVVGFERMAFLLEGLGIGGGADHSVSERSSRVAETWAVFLDSPLIGYSLGGVAPAIARLNGVLQSDLEVIKQYEGASVFLEVLAASGALGAIPFFVFVYALVVRPLRLARKLSGSMSSVLYGLVMALVFELMVLQLNQNILRLYLWLHIAVLSSCYAAFAREYWMENSGRNSQMSSRKVCLSA